MKGLRAALLCGVSWPALAVGGGLDAVRYTFSVRAFFDTWQPSWGGGAFVRTAGGEGENA